MSNDNVKTPPPTINPAILPYVPKSLIVASDPAVRAGMLWLVRAYGNNLPRGVDENAAVVLMLAADEYGLSPMEGITKLFMIGGRVVPSANTMLELAQRKGLAVRPIVNTEEAYEAEYSRPGREPFTYRYTLDEAKKAGLTGSDTWKKYPRQMLAARGNSTALRLYAGDLVGGGYSAEEVAGSSGSFDDQGNFRPDPAVTGPAPAPDFVAFEGRRAEPVPAGTPAPAAKPPAAPEVTPSPSAATALQQALPGKVVTADLDLTQGGHIPLTTQGNLPNITETSRAIFAAFAELYNPEMAKGVLKQKVESYGAASVGKLSPIDFMDLYRWADAQVGKARQEQPTIEEVAEQQAGEATDPTPIPAFNPHRGAATQGTGAVADGAASQASLDDQIMEAWKALAAVDREGEADAIFDKYGYEVGAEGLSQQIRRLVLQELQALTTQAA